MEIRGSIDIGSNSILLLVGEFSKGVFKPLLNESTVTALGRDLDKNGAFHPESMDISLETLKKYSKLARDVGLDPNQIIATATEASRVASNAKEFFQQVELETKIKVQTITSEAEAFYSTKGITFNSEFDEEEIFIMDIGGASTEVIQYQTKDEIIKHDFSLPMGAVRLTNWTDEGVENQKIEKILTDFSESLSKMHTRKLYCVAGTMTSVGNMYLGHKEFKEKEIHGQKISVSSIVQMSSKFQSYSEEDFLNEFPFLGKRAKTINGGLRVALEVFASLGVEEVEISTYGLRYGTLEAGGIKNEYLA